jgi:hypothetical protein
MEHWFHLPLHVYGVGNPVCSSDHAGRNNNRRQACHSIIVTGGVSADLGELPNRLSVRTVKV